MESTPAGARLEPIASVLVGLALYSLHAAQLGSWIVDDAGISFAYARSLAQGHGLLSQPGVPAVEGFSNPLWTLLLSGFFAAGVFHPVVVPKLLAFLLVGATYALIAVEVRRPAGPRVPGLALVAPVLLSVMAPFVVWTSSGLENALLAFLAAASCALCRRALSESGRGLDVTAGAVAALLALTRPDGIVYAAAYPIALTLRAWLRGRFPPLAGELIRFAGGLVPILAAWQAVRLAWFGDVMPNTYYAKGGPDVRALADAAKLFELLWSGVGPPVVLALGLVLLGLVVARGRRDGLVALPALHLLLASAAYLLLPVDWMGEYRFATPTFVFLAWSLAEALGAISFAWPSRLGPVVGSRVAAAGFVVAIALGHAPRVAAFATDPTVPFAWIRSLAGEGFNQVAAAAHVSDGSVLLPDVGGALYASNLRVHDLAGLCDRTTARTIGVDPPAFRDYVFDVLRPTFIHVHGVWSVRARLHEDARLARDYVVLHEAWSRPGGDSPRAEPWTAGYARRDALADDEALAAALRAYQEAGLDQLGPWPRPKHQEREVNARRAQGERAVR
jgi:hypothetical protein